MEQQQKILREFIVGSVHEKRNISPELAVQDWSTNGGPLGSNKVNKNF